MELYFTCSNSSIACTQQVFIKGSPENSGQVHFWSSTDPILQILLFFFPKNPIVPQMLSKKLSQAFFLTPCAKWWVETIYSILDSY